MAQIEQSDKGGKKKKGAQNGAYLKNPDFEGFQKLYNGCGGLIAIADIAPELPGAEDFIRRASKLCTVSVAHTDAGYEDTKKAFDAGATHLTHLYNAMPGIHHREPGVIPAAAEKETVRAELICDGIHVHPASVRLAFGMFGRNRIVLISDGLRCTGMPDGAYELGGQTVHLSGGVAKLSDGTIAGAATHLFQSMKNAMAFGIPEAVAVQAATFNPACAIGKQDSIGGTLKAALPAWHDVLKPGGVAAFSFNAAIASVNAFTAADTCASVAFASVFTVFAASIASSNLA